jgi:hypothetical protein
MFDNRHKADDYLAEQLGELGLNLRQPQLVEHLFYFQRRDHVDAAAMKLQTDGFFAEVSSTPSEGVWSLRVKGQMVLAAESMAKSRTRMEQFAVEYGGSYDGWGTPSARAWHNCRSREE